MTGTDPRPPVRRHNPAPRRGARVTVSAAGQRVIVRPEHLAGLLDDLSEHEEDQ